MSQQSQILLPLGRSQSANRLSGISSKGTTNAPGGNVGRDSDQHTRRTRSGSRQRMSSVGLGSDPSLIYRGVARAKSLLPQVRLFGLVNGRSKVFLYKGTDMLPYRSTLIDLAKTLQELFGKGFAEFGNDDQVAESIF